MAANFVGSKASAGIWHKIINEIPAVSGNFYFGFLGKDVMFRKLMASLKQDGTVRLFGFEISSETIQEHWSDFSRADADNSYASGCATIYNSDFPREFLPANAAILGSEDFIYADPPYPPCSVKRIREYYANTLTDEEHEHMLKTFLSVRAKVAISTYDNPIYKRVLKGWRKINFPAMTRSGAGTETVYFNYAKPDALQVFDVFGSNNIHRQAMQRLAERWRVKLRKYDQQTREYLVSEMTRFVAGNRYVASKQRNRKCKWFECHKPFKPTNARQEFCPGGKCKQAYHRWQLKNTGSGKRKMLKPLSRTAQKLSASR